MVLVVGLLLQKAAASRRTPKSGERGGEVLVDQKPGGATLFEDAGVADLEIHGFAVLGFFGEMHGDGEPGDVAVASDL